MGSNNMKAEEVRQLAGKQVVLSTEEDITTYEGIMKAIKAWVADGPHESIKYTGPLPVRVRSVLELDGFTIDPPGFFTNDGAFTITWGKPIVVSQPYREWT